MKAEDDHVGLYDVLREKQMRGKGFYSVVWAPLRCSTYPLEDTIVFNIICLLVMDKSDYLLQVIGCALRKEIIKCNQYQVWLDEVLSYSKLLIMCQGNVLMKLINTNFLLLASY
jgi:hypothetical protein